MIQTPGAGACTTKVYDRNLRSYNCMASTIKLNYDLIQSYMIVNYNHKL
jgi:hypothetical protein